LGYPFVGEVGRWAFRQALTRRDDYFEYVVDDRNEVRLLMPIRRKGGELTLVRRFGQPGRLMLLGGGLAYHELTYPGDPEEIHAGDYANGSAVQAHNLTAVGSQREPIDDLRLVVLLGRRSVRWIQRRGLDSMRGQQDVALGTQAQLTLGRSLPRADGDDNLTA